jgi:hypothetical protein
MSNSKHKTFVKMRDSRTDGVKDGGLRELDAGQVLY